MKLRERESQRDRYGREIVIEVAEACLGWEKCLEEIFDKREK